MQVGLMVPQSAEDGEGGTWPQIDALARHAEAGGLDSLWVADHFLYRPGDGTEYGYYEPWTLVAALAATTSSILIGTLVLATSFRGPGLTAKMAVAADEVSDGRLILGLGCGWHEPEYVAFGYPFDHRVSRFAECLQIIAPLVRGKRVTFDGRWHETQDAVVLPPARRDPPRILVAANGDRMLRLTAQQADLWQTAWFGLPDARYRDRHERFLAACEAEDRDPSSVGITVGVEVGAPEPPARPPGWKEVPLEAGPLADALATWQRRGVVHVQLSLPSATRAAVDVVADALERFRGRSR